MKDDDDQVRGLVEEDSLNPRHCKQCAEQKRSTNAGQRSGSRFACESGEVSGCEV